MLAQDIPVGKPVVITYVDSASDGKGTTLMNNRQYFGVVTETRPAPLSQKQSKAKGFTSDTLILTKTTVGYRQFYNGRIVSCRKQTIVERVKAALGLIK